MRVLLLFLLLCFTATVEAAAQHATAHKATPPAPASATGAKLTPASLHTDKLNYGDDLKRIYVGDFEHVGFKPDSTEFGMVVGGYMTQYSESCARYLPADKVQIMTQECSQEAWTVNGYGVEQPGSRHCVSYRTVGTGRYADPQVYALQKKLDAGMAVGMISDVLNGLKQQGGDPAGGMKKTTDVMIYVKEDMDHFLDENACAAAATMRFQANMLRYGRGEEAIRMAGGAEAVAVHAPLAKGQNYARMVDDLVKEESSAWMMNRYSPGSVEVNAVQHDSSGEPREIDARYGFMMMGQPGMGQVRVTFGDGAPECLFFSDFPTTCRAPSPKVLSAYKRNQYADATAPTYQENAPEPPRPQPRPQEAALPGMAGATPSVVAARQAAIRPGAPFGLDVQTLDVIDEASALAGGTFRAKLQRPIILKDAILPAGATVYLNVALEQRPSGPYAHADLYKISVSKVETEGKSIAVTTSNPTQVVRRVITAAPNRQMYRPPSYRAPVDPSAIAAGTSMNFLCQEAAAQATPSP